MLKFLPLTVLLIATPASAETVGESQARVVRMENEWTQLDGSRVRLEKESGELGAEIERVKNEPAGVRRDFRLRELLASAKVKADDLTRVAAELRARTAPLAEARRALIANCDRALGQPSLTEAKRLELARLRTAQAALLAMPTAPLGQLGTMTGKVVVDPLDGPRELKEKADLLRDSGDKLKREVARLTARIDDVERRRHLRERAGAVDEDWFGEATSNRKFARTGTIANTHDAKTQNNDATNNPAVPAPGLGGGTTTQPTGGVTGEFGASNNSGNSRATDSTVLRNLVDPATLDELRRTDGGDDLERQVRALKKAQGELEGLAAELERRAKSLSSRADELKKQK
jgi:hypothetical protein